MDEYNRQKCMERCFSNFTSSSPSIKNLIACQTYCQLLADSKESLNFQEEMSTTPEENDTSEQATTQTVAQTVITPTTPTKSHSIPNFYYSK